MATTPDSGASHVGFRVTMTMGQWKAARDRAADAVGEAAKPEAVPTTAADSDASEPVDGRE